MAATQSLTLNVPSPIYEHLKQRAEQSQRSVEDETLEMLAIAVPAGGALPEELSEVIESLKSLPDADLWEAGRRRLDDGVSEQLEELHLKQQRHGLTEAERRTLGDLVARYERRMLLRAQAAALLRARGHDVSELQKP